MLFFFFNDTATTEIYTLSLHDALPISPGARHVPDAKRLPLTTVGGRVRRGRRRQAGSGVRRRVHQPEDRKSTRLNSSHANISYAVFCLKKKTKNNKPHYLNQFNTKLNI